MILGCRRVHSIEIIFLSTNDIEKLGYPHAKKKKNWALISYTKINSNGLMS